MGRRKTLHEPSQSAVSPTPPGLTGRYDFNRGLRKQRATPGYPPDPLRGSALFLKLTPLQLKLGLWICRRLRRLDAHARPQERRRHWEFLGTWAGELFRSL